MQAKYKPLLLIPAIFGGLILLIVLFVAVDGSSNEGVSSGPLSPEETVRQALTRVLGSGNRKGVPKLGPITASETPKGLAIVVHWAIDMNLTEGLTKRGARSDIIDMLGAIQRLSLPVATVELVGSYAMVDVYGKENEKDVISATYSSDTIGRADWDKVRNENVFLLADTAIVHPAFQP